MTYQKNHRPFILLLLFLMAIGGPQLYSQKKVLCCEGNLLKNPNFESGVRVGNGSIYGCNWGGSSSYVNNWCGIGSPQYAPSTNPIASGMAMVFWGIGTNFSAGEGIYQQTSLVAGTSYSISFDGVFSDQVPTGPDEVILRFRAYNSPVSSPNQAGGVLIGEFTIKNTSWGRYTLPTWTAPANYSYLVITAHNNSAINHGNYVSWGWIDNICLIRTLERRTRISESKTQDLSGQLTGSEAMVWPNPAKDRLNFASKPEAGTPVSAEIYDLQGRKISSLDLKTSGNESSFDVSQLPKGLYLLKVAFKDGNYNFAYKFEKF